MSDHDDHHDDRDRITSLADDMTKRTSAPETAHDSPMLQARVRIPDGTDRRQWLKQQSKSRKQKRRSSGDAKRTPSSSSPTASGERFSNHRSPSQDSSQGGDESDTSCSSSVMSGLSIVSTPEPSRRQRQIKELRFSVEHAASEVGSPDRSGRSRVPPSFNAPSPTPSAAAAAAAAAAGRARRTISRTSSSSSSLSMLGSSSWMRWCSVCEAEFTKLRRPHRCRRCLEAVCASCSPARLPVPGMANPELKRTCRLCAGGSRAPQLDDALTRYRPEVEPPAAAAADATAGASSGSIRRSNSVSGMMGGIINRAPLGVLTDVAGAVKAGLYPGAPGAADGAGGTGGGGSTGDPPGDDVGVTTPGGSLRKRLSAGGAAALGAIGAGISLAGDRSFRRRGGSVGSASDRPSVTEADADGGSGEPSGGEGGVTTPGGSLRKRLSAGGAAAWGAIGAGIGLSGDRSSRRRDDSAGSAGELSAGVDVDNNDGSGDLYSSEVGVTTPGGSIRKRLSTGGAAAWDAIGAGIGLSSDRSSRKRDDSAGSAGEPPAVVEGDVDYGSGDLYSSEVGVTTPGGSIRKRLSAGGAAAWDAIGAGIGMSSDKSSRKRDDSQGSAGELSAGVDYDMDEGSGDLYGSEVGVTTPGGSIRKRLSAGGAAAWGVIGTGIGRWSGKSPGEEGGAAAGAADTEHRLADDDLVAGSHRAEEMDELEEVHAGAANKRAVADADGPPVRRTNAELSLAVRIAIGDPTATAAGKERPAEAKAGDDGQSAPAQQEMTTAKPPLHSTVTAVEVSDYQAAPSGADEAAPSGNGEEPQSELATVVVVEGAERERAEGKAATVEGTGIEDVIENTADVSGDVLVEASRGGAAGGDGASNAPESKDGATNPGKPSLATSDALSASRDESLGVAQMPEAAAPVEDGAIAEAPIVDTAGAEGYAPADVPPKDAGAIDEKVEVPAEAERVEEAEQPAAVTSETIAEAKGELPEVGAVLEVVAPVEDCAVAEAPIDATSEVAGEVPQVARATEAIAPPKDGAVGAVVQAPLENTIDAGGDWPVDAPSESVAGTEDNVEVPAEAARAEEAERSAPAVTLETNEEAADESPERGEALEVVAPAEDDGVTEVSINTATDAVSDAPVNALLEAAESTQASVAQDRTAPFVSETVAAIADEVPQVAQTPEADVPTKDRAVAEVPVETTAGAGDDASVDFSSKSAEETDDAEQSPAEVELVEEVEQPAPATPEVGSQAADELPERVEVLEGVAPAEDGAVPEAPSDADTSAGDDAPVDAPPGSAVRAEVPSKEGRAGEAEVTAPVTSVSVTEAAEGLLEDGEIPHAVTPVEDDDVIEAPTAHDVSAEGDASVNAPSDVVSGVDDAVEAATLIGRTGEAEEPAPVSLEAVVDTADELSENTADADGEKRLDPQGAASESGDDTEVQAAEGQIGDAEELVPVAPEAVPSVVVVEGPSDAEEWTEVVAPVEHDAVADAPSDGITGAGEEAPDVDVPEIPTAEEEETIEKGAVLAEAMQNAPDASETVTQVAVDPSEAEEAAEVLMPVDDDAALGAPVEDTTGAGGDTPVDESHEHAALNDDVVKVLMAAGDVSNDEQPGPITSGLPLEAADDSPGVEEAAEAATLVEGDVVADEPIGTSFVSPVSEAAAAAAVAAVEEREAEKTAEEAEQPAPVASDCVSEALEESPEVGAEAKALDPTESGAESDAPIAAPPQTAEEVPVVDERAPQAEETGPVASEAVSGASGDSFEDGGQVVPETTAPQEDDAVAEVPIEETVEGDAPVAAPPEVDVAEEDRPGGVGHPAPVWSMPVVEVGDELSEEAETTDVVPPADDGVVADAPTDDDAGAGAETPDDAPPPVATGNDDVAEMPQEMRHASKSEQSDPTAAAISSDAAGGSREAGGVPDDTVPEEDDAVAEATIDDDTGAEGDESVDASSEAAPAAEIPVVEEEQEQAVQSEQRSTVAPGAEIAHEVSESAENAGTASSVEDGNIVEAAIEGDAGTGHDVPADAPPEVDTAVEARVVEGGQPAPVASEPVEGVRDDLPEKEGDPPVITAPMDDDVAADAPTSNNAGVEGETPVDARAGTAAGNEGAAEASMAEEPKGEAEQPAPNTAALGGEVTEESPGVQELTGVVAPVEDDAVAGVPTEHVAGAGVDEPVDSPPEAAATTEAPPAMKEQAVHIEQHSSVPSEAKSEVANEVSETTEVAAVDATVEDDTSNETLVEAGASAEGDASVDAPEQVDVTAEIEGGDAEQLHPLASDPTAETEEMVSEEGGSPEAAAPMDADDAVADAPTKETPGAEGEAHVESLTEITTGTDDMAEVSAVVSLVEEPTGEAERPVPVTTAAALEATDESSEMGESAEIVAAVEDGAVVDAPAESVNSDGGDAPADVPSEATATVEVPVAEEHGVQAEQLTPVASGDVVEVANELSETAETARASATKQDDADDVIDEEPIEDGASDGEHAPVDLSAEIDGLVEEHAEQAEQPVPAASAPSAEVAGESPEEGGPVEIMVPVCDDAVADDEATDDVAVAESDAPVDAPPEAAIAAEVPALEVLPVQAEEPAPVASEASAEVAPEPSEAGDAVAAATPAKDESVSGLANDNFAGDGGDASDGASSENGAVVEEMVTGMSGEAGQPAPAASETESVAADELPEGNVAATDDAAPDLPQDVTTGVDESAAVKRVVEAEQPALPSELLAHDAGESSEAGGTVEDVAIVEDEAIAEEPAGVLSEDKADSQAGKPIEASPDIDLVDHHKTGVPSTTRVGEAEESSPVAAVPLPGGMVGSIENVGGAPSDAPTTSALEIEAQESASTTVGNGREEGNGATLPVELAEPAAETSGGHAGEITADAPAVAADVSPAAMGELVTRKVKDSSTPRSDESEVSTTLRESSPPAREARSRAASAEMSEVDEASRVDAETTLEEAPESARDVEDTAPVTSPKDPPRVADSAPETGQGGEEVEAMLKDDDNRRAPVEPMQEAAADASTSLEGVPATPGEASEEADSAPAIAEDVNHSVEAEAVTTADPSTGSVEELPEVGDARPAPSADNGSETPMTAGSDDAAPLELEDDSRKQQPCLADADSSSAEIEVNVPLRGKFGGEADGGDPGKAGDSATTVLAAGAGGESMEVVVSAAAPGGSFPSDSDVGAPAQSADEDGDTLVYAVEDADAISGKSGAGSITHEEVAADASAAAMDEEALEALGVDSPSVLSTEDAQSAEDGVPDQGSAPAAKGPKPAATGAGDFAETAVEGVVGTAAEKPAPLVAGDVPTAAPPDLDTEVSIPLEADDKREETGSVPTGGGSTRGQEAIAATSSESELPPSSEAREDGAEGRAAAAIEETGTEAKEQIPHPPVPGDARSAPSDQPAAVDVDDERIRASPKVETKASVPTAAAEEGLEQTLGADRQDTDPREAFEVCGRELVPSSEDQVMGDTIKWFRFRAMPCDEPNTVAASVAFFLFFFAFVACLRSSDS